MYIIDPFILFYIRIIWSRMQVQSPVFRFYSSISNYMVHIEIDVWLLSEVIGPFFSKVQTEQKWCVFISTFQSCFISLWDLKLLNSYSLLGNSETRNGEYTLKRYTKWFLEFFCWIMVLPWAYQMFRIKNIL